MDNIKTLLARYRQTALLFAAGLVLIVYISLGFLFLQQDPQQLEYENQINKLSLVLRNPLPNIATLRAQYDAVNAKLAPIADNVTILMLVNLAREKGIDVGEENGKFQVPVASHGSTTIGGVSYALVSFKGVHVQGEYDKVISFVSALDSGSLMETIVLTRVNSENRVVQKTGEEAEAALEKNNIEAAIEAMKNDNRLTRIPAPVRIKTNFMGDDPSTLLIFEGFPDNSSTPAQKGYTGNATPRQGYVLWQNDKISSDNTSLFSTANYTASMTTKYYYYIEDVATDNGTVTQVIKQTDIYNREFKDSLSTKVELSVTLDLDIYYKP